MSAKYPKLTVAQCFTVAGAILLWGCSDGAILGIGHKGTSATNAVSVELVASDAQAYGINAHRPTGELANQLFDKARAGGFSWVRVDIVWENVEPTKGSFDWSKTDDTIRSASARGLNIYANLHDAPKWANGNKPSQVAARDAADWKNFCREVALRYDGKHGLPKVDVFGLWNEPDGSGLGESGDSRDKKLNDYVNLILIPGYRAIHDVRADARVAAPDLASEPDFLKSMLKNAKDYVDIVSVHKYSDEPANVAAYTDQIVSIMKNSGMSNSKPMWLTETGWSTQGKYSCWFKPVDASAQASRSTQLLDQLAKRTRVEKVFFYELMDDDNPGACQWGLLRSDRSEKPAYRAVRDYIFARAPQARPTPNTGTPPSSTNGNGGSAGSGAAPTVCKRMVTKQFSDGMGVVVNSKNFSGDTAGQCDTSCEMAGKGYTGCATRACAAPGTRNDSLCQSCNYEKQVEETYTCQ